MNWKGIVLAGGSGSRLYPATLAVSKQLLPVYDKPMTYYLLTTLMLAGIWEILIISTPTDVPRFESLLGDGTKWGLTLSYCVRPTPDGLPQAFILGREFVGKDNVARILGDNIFYGNSLVEIIRKAVSKETGGTVFGYSVSNPERYGVMEFDENKNVLSIEEKPTNPRSNYAVTGLYFYDNEVLDIAKTIKPSKRGELEITDVNTAYLRNGSLTVEILGRGMAWLDIGIHEALLQASVSIETIEKRQGLKVACPEEIAYRGGWIPAERFRMLANTTDSIKS